MRLIRMYTVLLEQKKYKKHRKINANGAVTSSATKGTAGTHDIPRIDRRRPTLSSPSPVFQNHLQPRDPQLRNPACILFIN